MQTLAHTRTRSSNPLESHVRCEKIDAFFHHTKSISICNANKLILRIVKIPNAAANKLSEQKKIVSYLFSIKSIICLHRIHVFCSLAMNCKESTTIEQWTPIELVERKKIIRKTRMCTHFFVSSILFHCWKKINSCTKKNSNKKRKHEKKERNEKEREIEVRSIIL